MSNFDEVRLPSTDWRAYRGVLSRRVFAFLIDYAIVALLWVPAAVVVFFLGIITLGLGWMLYPALFVIVAMLYFGLTIGGPNQAIFVPSGTARSASASAARAERHSASSCSGARSARSAAASSTKVSIRLRARCTSAWNPAGSVIASTAASSVQARWPI